MNQQASTERDSPSRSASRDDIPADLASDSEIRAGRLCLQSGAIASFAVAALHVGCIFTGEATARFFGAPRFVLTMIQQRSLAIIPVVLAIVAVLGTFGLYAWSAAGRMRRLPALRAGLIAAGAIYALRGLFLAPQLAFMARHPGALPWQFPVFSAVSLALGALYLFGAAQRWTVLRHDLTPG